LRTIAFLASAYLFSYFTMLFMGDLPIMFMLALFRERLRLRTNILFLMFLFFDDLVIVLFTHGSTITCFNIVLPFSILLILGEICIVYTSFILLIEHWRLRERIGVCVNA